MFDVFDSPNEGDEGDNGLGVEGGFGWINVGGGFSANVGEGADEFAFQTRVGALFAVWALVDDAPCVDNVGFECDGLSGGLVWKPEFVVGKDGEVVDEVRQRELV